MPRRRSLSIYPNVRFIVAGGGDFRFRPGEPRPRRSAWATGSSSLAASPTRTATGSTRSADCAVFPSLYEPFGIVALEAMAAGCPVVATDTGGLIEVISLHENGMLVHPDDPGSLAWGVLHTLVHPDWARRRASAPARCRYVVQLGPHRQNDQGGRTRRYCHEARAGDWAYSLSGDGSAAPSEPYPDVSLDDL